MVFQPYENMPTKQVEVAVALIHKGGRILVTRRRDNSHLAGYDEFPGGRRRPSESLEECLRREVMEETGYGIRIVRLVGTKRHLYPEQVTWLWFYLCEPQPSMPSQKGSALNPRWIRIPELSRLRWPPANERIIEMFQTQQAS